MNKPWGMFAQPDFTRLETVAELCDRGMSFIRIGMEPDKVFDNLEYLQQATTICSQVYLNLMKCSATPAHHLLRLLDMVSPDIAGLYIVDSYGAMLPTDIYEYVTLLRDRFQIIGFHGHDNLGLANANSLAAVGAGARMIDGTLNGVGRGAGNAEIESLASIISILYADRFDYKELASLAEFCHANMDIVKQNREMEVLGGVIGIHSGLFQLIEELCAEYEIKPARLMEVALGLASHSPCKSDIQAAAQQIADHDGGQRKYESGQEAVGIR
jgi:isopropylmalate/homocitrate/citramalate synthase